MRLKRLLITLSAVVFLSLAADMVSDTRQKTERYYYGDYLTLDLIAPIRSEFELPSPTPKPKPNRATLYYQNVIKPYYLNDMMITVKTLKLTSLGRYYLTAYCNCSRCCTYANQPTASGVYPHYSEDFYTPTTCAIDRKLHKFGELFYIPSENRLFIAEDTGSAIQNNDIDLYFEDHSRVSSYGSHTEEIFRAEVIELTFKAEDYDIHTYLKNKFIEEVR